MYEIKQYTKNGLSVYEFYNNEANSWLKVCPERGGIITSLGLEGEELLYLNEETLYDTTKNIRGGIPFLFPICGKLEGNKYSIGENTYELPNHGFARNMNWEVLECNPGDVAVLKMTLKSNSQTKKLYPFDFELIFTYELAPDSLTINQEYINKSNIDMPYYSGFHPYFITGEKSVENKFGTTKYLDYHDMKIKRATEEFSLKGTTEALALIDSKPGEVRFNLKEISKNITLSYGSEFKYVVLWTEEGTKFICVEPWMALMNEMNRKKDLQILKPLSSNKTYFKIVASTL